MAHSVEVLETAVRAAHKSVKALEGDDFTDQMLLYIHRPGFTTPQELMLLTGMLESIQSQGAMLARMREKTLSAAAAIAEGATAKV